MESTRSKNCPVWAMVEVTQRDPLFNDASVCGDWCTRFSKEYDVCRDEMLKEMQIKKLINAR